MERDAIADVYALGENQHQPEAVDVLVVGAITETIARAVAPMLARALYPDRRVGSVIHAEPVPPFAGEPAGSFYVAVEIGGRPFADVRVGR